MESEERQGIACQKPAYSVYNQMNVDLKAPSIGLSQSKQIDSFGEEHAPRIRKPYTITKQRERWTEEEHNKFVEALHLYGRSWRQIEEHIGTKTAVQIRSHAQKFFSKVVREAEAGSNDNASALKVIEIPPPRPKKKPVHPYPRKCGTLSNSATPILKHFQKPLHIPAICEVENRSPTSVLSAFGSENLDSTFSNSQLGCSSPVSSAAGSNDQEDGGQFAMAVQEENKIPLFGAAVSKSTMQDHPQMNMIRCPDVHASSQAREPTLKLFGKMVVVKDSNKPSTPDVGNASQSGLPLFTDLQGNQGNRDLDLHSHPEHSQTAKQASSPEEPSRSSWNAGPALVPPLFYCFPLVSENSMIEPAFGHHPWWGAMYGNLPFSFVHPQSQQLLQSAMQAGGEQEMQREGSWTGSNTESVSGTGLCSQNTDAVDSKKAEIPEEHAALPFSGLKRSNAPSSTSGTVGAGNIFTPYKRCAVEREEQHYSAPPSDDNESQAIRLCL